MAINIINHSEYGNLGPRSPVPSGQEIRFHREIHETGVDFAQSMNKKVLKTAGILFLVLAGCSEIKVDTFQKWCELISGEDLKDKYAKIWVIKYSVSIDEDRIRDDFILFLNRSLLKKVQYKVPQMAWKKDIELHIVNLSSIQNIEPEKMIEKWKHGLSLALQKKHTDLVDICIYNTVTRLFDILYIHTMTFDNKGRVIKDVLLPIRLG